MSYAESCEEVDVLPRLEGAVGDERGASGASAGLVERRPEDLEPGTSLAGLPQVEGLVLAALLQGGLALLLGRTLEGPVPAAGVLDHHPRGGGLLVQPRLDAASQHGVVPQPLLLTWRGDDARCSEVPVELDQAPPEPGATVAAGPHGVGRREVQERQLGELGAYLEGAARPQPIPTDLGHEPSHGRGVVGVGKHVQGLTGVDVHVLPGDLDDRFEQLRIILQQVLWEEDTVSGEAQVQGQGHERIVRAGVRGPDDGITDVVCQWTAPVVRWMRGFLSKRTSNRDWTHLDGGDSTPLEQKSQRFV